MKRVFTLLIISGFCFSVNAQGPQTWNTGQILQAIKKLNVLGSVLYIAAHPDDENTRLITYFANEKLYRTGYLSLTRGDGGQNLIGNEQGVELGLIRTQELLSARRIDGGEQFFSSAFDFGFSKNPEETFRIWDKKKILSDVVWVIRNFKPDVIITRFPTTGEGGHGHHTASAILANEAFIAAGDPSKFPDQLKYVKPWKPARILWNTFNFGGNNTTSDSQFKIDAGGFNPLLGKGYGEIAAQSRSQHKSQGFGSGASRGTALEYFKTTGGTAPKNSLFDDVDASWNRIGNEGRKISEAISAIGKAFDPGMPYASVPALTGVYKMIKALPDTYWKERKLEEARQLIVQCSGLFIDANSSQPFAVQSDSLAVNVVVNNRMGGDVKLNNANIDDVSKVFNTKLEVNRNYNWPVTLKVSSNKPVTQPFWLKEPMDAGHFHIDDQQMIGVADVQAPYYANISVTIAGVDLSISQPVRYRSVDPVKGESYQPLFVIPAATVKVSPEALLYRNEQSKKITVDIIPNKDFGKSYIKISTPHRLILADTIHQLTAGQLISKQYLVPGEMEHNSDRHFISPAIVSKGDPAFNYTLASRLIQYDHIPTILYFEDAKAKAVNIDLKTAGKKIGYIIGAGDKVPEALSEMGYDITFLNQTNIAGLNLAQFDAIITGVRSYNTNDWMNGVYQRLMNYVKEGGNLIVQYNTSTNIGPLRAKIGPYNFDISRTRVTDETADVKILDSAHPVFNFPNKITQKDFDGWIQERSIYHAANWDTDLKPLISMSDPGEQANEGSLLIGKYGKGYFTYTGLVFYRELPAGVSGAFRLMANLIALNAKR